MTYEEWEQKYVPEKDLKEAIRSLARPLVSRALPVAEAFAGYNPKAGLEAYSWVKICNWCNKGVHPLQLAVSVGVRPVGCTSPSEWIPIVSREVDVPDYMQRAAYELERVSDGDYYISDGVDASVAFRGF
jgi:hypothetical protein